MGGLLRMVFTDIPRYASWGNLDPEEIVQQIYTNFDMGTMKDFFLRVCFFSVLFNLIYYIFRLVLAAVIWIDHALIH